MKSLILYSQDSYISPYDFDSSVCKNLSYDKNVNVDVEFDRIINHLLSEVEYLNIIIPLCFGDILSDYLGLKLAVHIRTTITLNQNKNIFIYGFVGLNNLIQNDFFLVLKTTGVSLIDYNLFDIEEATKVSITQLEKFDLPKEIAKINLTIPTNYFDNHSIANLWGAFRVVEIAEIDIKRINNLNADDLKNIYFKWLQAKNFKLKTKIIEVEELNKEYLNEFRELQNRIKNAPIIDLSKFKKKRK
jgi:hypothetical protein